MQYHNSPADLKERPAGEDAIRRESLNTGTHAFLHIHLNMLSFWRIVICMGFYFIVLAVVG
jgi:hypothetical protein